ncbi:uncharacterized protein [Equus asinus]|uniref:uncharacterized protein n=1 Tax=Equus asinus TaxID=9793 RepID=UPI0038F804AE
MTLRTGLGLPGVAPPRPGQHRNRLPQAEGGRDARLSGPDPLGSRWGGGGWSEENRYKRPISVQEKVLLDRGAHLEVSPPVLLALSGASAPRPLGLHPGGAARSGHQGPGRSLGASDRRTLLVRCSKRRLAEGRAPSPESTITRSCRLLSRTQSPLDYQSGSNRSGHGAYTPHREHSRPATTCGGVVRRQQVFPECFIWQALVEALGRRGGQGKKSACSHEEDLLAQEPDVSQEPELTPHTENTELEGADGRKKISRLEGEKNPKKGHVFVEQVIAKGGENKDKLSSEKLRETEECVQHHPGPQGAG